MQKNTPALQQPVQKPVAPTSLRVDGLLDRLNHVRENIARRAHELFQKREGKTGLDQQDWFRAEEELLHAAHIAMYETNDALFVLAEVPRVPADCIAVSVEPRAVSIAGQRESVAPSNGRNLIYSERCSNQIFRSIALPVEVDPERSLAILDQGILELLLPKSAAVEESPESIHAYSIVRSKDFRRWTYETVQILRGFS
jgi:HSP20 family protein